MKQFNKHITYMYLQIMSFCESMFILRVSRMYAHSVNVCLGVLQFNSIQKLYLKMVTQ